ncbi:MAG TPA: trigger factor family protein, partial [Sphingomonadales bacterium]|nr:trigger factor family protein [Sphingomonadales bacterium]
MKIDQLTNEGLKQSYKVLIEAGEIEKKVKRELENLKSRVALKGFRPGKTPVKLLEKTHGKAVRGQLLEKMVNESIEKVYADHRIKPAMRPNVEILK